MPRLPLPDARRRVTTAAQPRTGGLPARMRALASVLVLALGLVAGLSAALPAQARDLYVSPGVEGRADGSRAAPYGALWDALKAREPGDDLVLLPGEYGRILLTGEYDPPLVIRAETPGSAHAEKIFVQKGRGMRVSGLALWPLTPVEKPYDLIESRGDDIRFSDLDLRGRADAPETYMDWAREDWTRTWRVSGIRMRGRDNAILDSRFTALAFPIQSMGDGGEIRGNRIAGFSGDAMRAIGDDSAVIGNRVENSFKVDENHNDGFQSWVVKGRKALRNLRVADNQIFSWTGPENHPLHRADGDLQGIGLFDGRFENVTVENNLVVVNTYHGISLYDAYDSRIVNNTVVNRSGRPDGRPWILLGTKRKNPEAKRHVLVANNVAMSYRDIEGALRRNAVARQPAMLFRDPLAGDFRPRPDGPLVGAGDAAVAPAEDIAGRARGPRVTLGAFEPE